jgi:hypothetical protein
MLTIATLSLLACLAGTTQPATSASVGALAGLSGGAASLTQDEAAPGAATTHEASYLSSGERWWDAGSLAGLKGTEHFYNPVGNPLYFETPLNNTGVKFLYLYHGFDDDSQLQGGSVNVVAAQARFAVTERLGIIATKDGWSKLDTGIGIDDDGWNDIAGGVKYAFYVDQEAQLVVTGGARVMLDNTGEAKVLQGGVSEISPFVSFAKGWGPLHVMGNITDRIPFDGDDGNNVLQWDVHADYEVADGIAPMIELHGLHYMSDGDRLPLSVGGLDYSNFGSSDVSGSTVIWVGLGARFKFNPHMSLGGTFEYPLTNRKADIMGERVTLDFELTF